MVHHAGRVCRVGNDAAPLVTMPEFLLLESDEKVFDESVMRKLYAPEAAYYLASACREQGSRFAPFAWAADCAACSYVLRYSLPV